MAKPIKRTIRSFKEVIKEMDKEDKEMYIKFPLIMLGVCIFGSIVSFFAFIKEEPKYFAYTAPVIFALLILFFATDWWEAMKNWRNGGMWKQNHPEEWRQRKEEREEAKKKEKEKITH